MKKLGWVSIPVILILSLILLWVVKPIFLSSFLTSRLGVRVVVGSIGIGTSKTTIGDFKIKNPMGYKTSNAFKADKTVITYGLKRLFGKVNEIDRIEISDIYLSVEFDNPLGTKNNWTKIVEKLPKHVRREKQFVIHKLVLNNLTVQIRGLGLSDTQTKQVSSVVLDEINSDDGFPTRELIRQIFGEVGIQQYLQDLINPANTIRKLFTPPFGTKAWMRRINAKTQSREDTKKN